MHADPHSRTLPAAVLWDLDGTLIESGPYWHEAEFEVAARHGGTWSDVDGIAITGLDLMDLARYCQAHMGITLTPEQILDEIMDGVVARFAADIPWRPGARELLAALRAAGVPSALVTMSYRRLVDPVIAALPDGSFAAVIVGDDVPRGKPHPEPYLAGMAALGVAAADCVAIEDSDIGARSAEAAGAMVLVVPNHVPVPDGPARRFEASLLGLAPDHLGALLRR